MKAHTRPSERRAIIRKRLQAGETPVTIARDLGVAMSTVYRVRDASKLGVGDRAGLLVVSTRVTDRERDALDRLVGQGRLRSRGAVLRRLIRLIGGFSVPNPEEEAFLKEADRHLSRLGGNFNQIAGALSRSVLKVGRADPTHAQIDAINRATDELAQIRTVVKQMLNNQQVRAEALQARLLDGIPEAAGEVDANG